jgi:hypothetical protein
MTFSLRKTISAGISPSMILQKMQLGSKATSSPYLQKCRNC